MPLLRIGGGIDYAIKSALDALSTLTIPTEERCELYFAINSEILVYLEKYDDLTNVYQHNRQSRIGSGIGIEQLFANDITNIIISALIGATIPPLLEPLKETLRNKII